EPAGPRPRTGRGGRRHLPARPGARRGDADDVAHARDGGLGRALRDRRRVRRRAVRARAGAAGRAGRRHRGRDGRVRGGCAAVAARGGLGRGARPARVAVAGAAMAGCAVLVHPEASVLRAAAMGAVGVVGIALGRPSRAVAALGVGVVVLLVVDPWLARSYGFVLSVAATAGLALLTAPIARRLAPWCGRTAAHVVAVPVAAQAACAPVLVLLDPSVSTWAVPANLLAAPALGPATVLGVLATLVAPWWPPAATALGWSAGLFTGWIAGVARVFADLPGARLPWPGGVGGLLLLAVLTAGALAVVLGSRALREAGERRAVRTASRPPLRERAGRAVRDLRRSALRGPGRPAARGSGSSVGGGSWRLPVRGPSRPAGRPPATARAATVL